MGNAKKLLPILCELRMQSNNLKTAVATGLDEQSMSFIPHALK